VSTLRRLTVVAAVIAAAAVGAAAAGARALERPLRAEIAIPPAAIPDRVLAVHSSAAAMLPVGAWGGEQTAATGERMTIYASARYDQDAAELQRWADFLSGLIHGSELAELTVYLAPPNEVARFCGAAAAACYGSAAADSLLVASGEDLPDGTSAEAVVTHEYGHHIAAHRNNAPWTAVDWGTKRWATYVGVCAGARAGRFFPGDEAAHYTFNPGEDFAETYRVLNARRAGIPEIPWEVVDSSLYPDDTALSLVEQDVTQPWTVATMTTLTGSATHTFSIATPLDGTLKVTLRAPARSRLRLRLGGSAVTTATAATLSSTVCGSRSTKVAVTRLSGRGTYRLTVSKP